MVHFNVFLICLHYDQALATEGLVQHIRLKRILALQTAI